MMNNQAESDKPQFLDSDKNIIKVSVPQKNLEKERHDENKIFEVRNPLSSDTNLLPNNPPFSAEITHQSDADSIPVTNPENIRRAIKYEEKPGPSGLSCTITSTTQKV